jgi:hypothetical protein
MRPVASALSPFSVQRLDTNLNGALGSTLGQIYNADSSRVGWVMYNGSLFGPIIAHKHIILAFTRARACDVPRLT